jgi:hypothetical protein
MKNPVFLFMRRNNEWLIWTIALIGLFFLQPKENHFSFCIFKWIGFEKCMGCGIGHAIHYALHFDFLKSWNEHILGVPATVILLFRIIQLLLKHNQNKLYGRSTTHVPA